MKKPLASDPHAGIDLHVHSTASDGTLAPPEILEMAVGLGLKAVSITDHDTLAGSAAALAFGIPKCLEFLTGIEISAGAPEGYPSGSSVHILGYGLNLFDVPLNNLLAVLQSSRENRNPQIIERLNTLGMDVTMEELSMVVGDATAGRPHIAQMLVAKGLADSIDDAFDRFLGKNRPAYVEKHRVPMKEAIEAIKTAGGVAVLAHPYLNGVTDLNTFEPFLLTLMDMGLEGIEAVYPEHPEEATAHYFQLATKHNLLITGGTDFHGAITPGIQMGVGKGGFHVPYSLYENLMEHLG
ncbi:PHP domain-containing protein [uncultured Desulfosarcina sp.]|uniref:PHP domain-containing protein n=1 Tax=uncultured Desulfosarcina sp. TaxID=218289 RepID=UPI0029C6A0E3|nr:PHP domain-containing protein [uncultured Desulfosarcina sp.]